jgi:hypothetical protein
MQINQEAYDKLRADQFALECIWKVMESWGEWSSDTIDDVAQILEGTGRVFTDPNDYEPEEEFVVHDCSNCGGHDGA